ncbi:hypothetical protein CTRI78_v010174 [Colletotrichum trifolii]|uniref:LrgB-like protein n=1 Tax=Colletotrichum trifolii TaxID=5466 RepID=A0A4R8QNM3_COLTR|nr:hypothetical protein CTRI78_v010174 [Colletotrichum trifolii]
MVASNSARFTIFLTHPQKWLRGIRNKASGVFDHLPLQMPSTYGPGYNHDGNARRITYGAAVAKKVVEFLGVVGVYLISQVLTWCFVLVFRLHRLQFLSTIFGMIMVFFVMLVCQLVWQSTDALYRHHIKSKVDFINSNIGIGFPVPLIAISFTSILDAGGIGRIIGNFLTTNVMFWILVFLLSWAAFVGATRIPVMKASCFHRRNVDLENRSGQPGTAIAAPDVLPPASRHSGSTTLNGTMTEYNTDKDAGSIPNSRTVSAYFTDSDCPSTTLPPPAVDLDPERGLPNNARVDGENHGEPAWIAWMTVLYPIVLSGFLFLAVGLPVFVASGDDRLLDGCMLWFAWISTTRLQRAFARSKFLVESPSFKRTITTLLNPVVFTTLAMLAYTRAKSAATGEDVDEISYKFSCGTSLSGIWTEMALEPGSFRPGDYWFGAGDAAVSLLECGIVVWGFKLFECRHQLHSCQGLFVVVVSFFMAGVNVFLSVLLSIAMGLRTPEAYAFATRSTTLALSRPATLVLGGNTVVNAALVVSNGVLAQLILPFLLPKLKIDTHAGDDKEKGSDSAVTVAAGMAVGINGAAMGVSYLYDIKSRAASYAALSMTVFGVMTVVFAAVEPFSMLLTELVSRYEAWL